jgi:hypothetical protein
MLSKDQLAQVWIPLRKYFDDIIDKLLKEFPELLPSATWQHSPKFPFTGYLSLLATRDIDRVEDCVLMMEVALVRGNLIVKYDIFNGHGDLFAYGPKLTFSAEAPDEEQIEFLLETEKAAEEFFTDNLDDVRRALMAADS